MPDIPRSISVFGSGYVGSVTAACLVRPRRGPRGELIVGTSLREVVETAEVGLIGTREVETEALAACLRGEQMVIDLVNLKKLRRPQELAF